MELSSITSLPSVWAMIFSMIIWGLYFLLFLLVNLFLYVAFLKFPGRWMLNVLMIVLFAILFYFTSKEYASEKFQGLLNALLMSSFYYLFLLVTLVDIGDSSTIQIMAKRNIRIMIGFVCAWVSTDMAFGV